MRVGLPIRRNFVRYTPDAKYALYCGVLESYARGDGILTLQDLFFGLTYKRHANDCGFRTLNDKGDDWRLEFSRAPRIVHTPEHPKLLTRYRYKVSAEAKRALQFAAQEASRNRVFWIDTDHLQCGIIAHDDQIAKLLETVGYSMEQTQALGASGRLKYPVKPPSLRTRLAVFPLLIPAIAFLAAFVAAVTYLHYQQ